MSDTIRQMKQVKATLPDELREILAARADAAGHSFSEECRNVLWAGLAMLTTSSASSSWHREAALTALAWGQAPSPRTVCKQCGAEFDRLGNGSKGFRRTIALFCSEPCKNRWHYQQRARA